MEENAPLDEQAIVAILRREHDAAESEWDYLRKFIQLSHNYYDAAPFGNEQPGRSQVVLPDVQETIDYMSVSVLRTFVSGDRVVEFEAKDEGDEELAEEATAAVQYNFMREQDGYRILSDWLNSGLKDRIGITKTMLQREEKVTREQTIVPAEYLGMIEQEPDDITDNGDGTYTVTVKRESFVTRSCDVAIPINEFRYSSMARHEDEAEYLAHVCAKTRSELIEMGFDRDQVYTLPTYSGDNERIYENRREVFRVEESSPALQKVLLCEEYARIDVDNDGIAERVKVFRVENEILRWQGQEAEPDDDGNPQHVEGDYAIEQVEDQPFAVFSPFYRPHHLVGYSLADKVMDIQLLRSTVARQLVDGMYNANMPRPVVAEQGASENTIDDLLSPIPGAPIRVKDTNAVVPYQTAFDVGKSLSVMEWITGERESRTGITRLNQGLDADTLNKTATGTALMQAQGQQQEEAIARNLAEAFGRLMVKKYRMMKAGADPFKIKVDGQYKMVDPANWPDDINLTIRVGLGSGSKDKRIQARMMLAPIMAEGFQNKQVTPQHIFHAVDGLVRDLGIGQGDDYWIDPDAPPEIDPATGQPKQQPQEAQQPDPEAMKAQAQIQIEQQKLQLAQQQAAAGLQLQQQKDQATVQAMRERHALEMDQKREQAALEAELAQQKADAEAQIAIYRINKEAEVDAYAANMKAANDTHISENRSGGALDA